MLLSDGTDSWPLGQTSSPLMNVTAGAHRQLTSLTDDTGDGDNGGVDDGGGGGGLVRYGRRKHIEDDTLYIVLGVIVGTVLIGVLVTLFICARQQHKQRLLIGTVPVIMMIALCALVTRQKTCVKFLLPVFQR